MNSTTFNEMINNQPLVKKDIQVLTAGTFYNNSDESSIRSHKGFLKYFQELSDEDQFSFKSLLEIMNKGIYIDFDIKKSNDGIKDEFKVHLPWEQIDHTDKIIVLTVWYDLDINKIPSKCLISKLPSINGLEEFIRLYKSNNFETQLSVEDLLIEAKGYL